MKLYFKSSALITITNWIIRSSSILKHDTFHVISSNGFHSSNQKFNRLFKFIRSSILIDFVSSKITSITLLSVRCYVQDPFFQLSSYLSIDCWILFTIVSIACDSYQSLSVIEKNTVYSGRIVQKYYLLTL